MLHLRVIVPDHSVARVRALLQADPSVTNIIVIPNAALEPPGHLLMCDVARESASLVLGGLRASGVVTEGSIALETVDVSLSAAADAAEEEAPGHPADAVVWEEVQSRTSEESELSFTFLAFMCIAAVIAAVGILTDSQIAIVGAMVVGPEFGPIAALCVAAVQRDAVNARRSAFALLVGFPAAVVASFLFTGAVRVVGLLETTPRGVSHPLTDFISEPNAYSFVVAFAAGVAGTLSLTSAKSGALIGVLISVTTIPAAANIGVAAAVTDWAEVSGAGAQLAVNLLALVSAGIGTLALQRAFWRRALTAGRRR